MMLGPVVAGERVRLAPPPPNFAEIVLPWFEDADVQRWVIRFPLDLEGEREFLARAARNPDTIFWAIWADGRPIGTSGIISIDWQNRHAETGSVIGLPEYRGRGYGSEAMRLRTGYAFSQLGLEKLVAYARSDNWRSIHALQAVGYREVGVLRRHTYADGRWYDRWLGEVLREEWAAEHGG